MLHKPYARRRKMNSTRRKIQNISTTYTTIGYMHMTHILIAVLFNIFVAVFNCFRWYGWWEKSKFFVADENSSKPPFVIVSALQSCDFSLRVKNINIHILDGDKYRSKQWRIIFFSIGSATPKCDRCTSHWSCSYCCYSGLQLFILWRTLYASFVIRHLFLIQGKITFMLHPWPQITSYSPAT